MRRQLKHKRKLTGEGKLFDQLWMERIHCSALDGQPISEFERSNRLCFAHVLSKRKYPLFRLYDKNILFLKYDQHTFFDNMTDNELTKRLEKGEDWEWIFQLKEDLKSEYEIASREWNEFGCFPDGSNFYDLNPEK